MPESLEAFWSETVVPIEIAAPRALPLLTNSAATTYADCPRKYFYSYVLGRRPLEKSFPLTFGTIIHSGLDAWWSAFGEDRLSLALAAINAACDKEGVKDEFERAKAEIVIEGYHYRWCEIQDRYYTTIQVEHKFRVPLSEEWDLGGAIDKIVIRDGVKLLSDHKTVGSEDFSPGSDYQQRTNLTSQASIYWRAAKDLGHDVTGFLYDAVRRPGLKPQKATPVELRKYTKATKKEPSRLYSNQREADETVEEYRDRLREVIGEDPEGHYARWIVVRLEDEEREAALDISGICDTITNSTRAGNFPRYGTFNGACRKYGSACCYLPVCAGYTTIEDNTRYRKTEEVNEELV